MLNREDYERLLVHLKRYMDDGFVPLPKSISANIFLQSLNNLHPSIKFTLEKATITNNHLKELVQTTNFLDVKVMLDTNNKMSTDIYYKSTNSHDYLHYDSFHPKHTIDNIPFNLAKRIIVFVSDDNLVETRLNELRFWLRKCKYPTNLINKAFHNAKLQGPAPEKPSSKNIIPFVIPHMLATSIFSLL